MRLFVLLSLCVVSLLSFSAVAATRFVAIGGSDAGDCTGAPCATLTYAIAQAVDGDTISVGPGTFNNGGAAVQVTKSVALHGAQAGVDAKTRVAATETILTSSVLLDANGAALDGFTITCGACPSPATFKGGVVTTATRSGYAIANNIITGNTLGILLETSGVVQSSVQFNRIFDNSFNFGSAPMSGNGVIGSSMFNVSVVGNRIYRHLTAQVFVLAGGTVTISGNDFPLLAVDGTGVIVSSAAGTQVLGNTIQGGLLGIGLGEGSTNTTVSGNTIDGSSIVAVQVSSSGTPLTGLVVTGNVITNSATGVRFLRPTSVELHFNRITGNALDLEVADATTVVNGENNWWGCNGGPAACAVLSIVPGATVDLTPWLVMDITATPSTIDPFQTSVVSADLNQSSDGAAVAGFPDGVLVTFTATGGTVAPPVDGTSAGVATTVFTPVGSGAKQVHATLDDQTVSTPITVTPLITTVTLTSGNNPSDYGEPVTFTATLGNAVATGTVEFFEDGNSLGTAPVAAGVAQLTTSALPGGTHSVTAVYSGDLNFAQGTSNAIAQVVMPIATALTLTSNNNPSAYSEDVTFTATLGATSATGTVEFFEDGNSLGTAPVVAGAAQLTTAALAAGTHAITAVYSGDTNFVSATSNAVSQVVEQATSSLVLTSGNNPADVGENVTFTATLGNGAATGTVQFFADGDALGTAPVVNGIAQFTTDDLPPGLYVVTAVYSGDANFTGATSNALTQLVNAAFVEPIPALSPMMLALTAMLIGAAGWWMTRRMWM